MAFLVARLLVQNKLVYDLCQHFEDNCLIAKLAYMADLHEHLNTLNTKMQGKKKNILTCSNKLKKFGTLQR